MKREELLFKTIQATRAISLLTATKILTQFIVQLILLRTLTPEIFGVFVFVQMLVGFFTLFANVQGDRFIIKQKEKVKETFNICFSFEFILGIIIMTILLILCPFIANFLNKPVIVKYLQVFVLVLLFDSLINCPRSLFERNLEFGKANISAFFGVVANAAVSILLAILGFGIWSLIFGIIACKVLESFVLWRTLPFKPRIFFEKKILLEAIKFGLPITFSTVVAFSYSNIDKFMISKTLGDTQLGYYWFAFTVPHFLLFAQENLATVIFPAFVNAKDGNQLKRGFSRATKLSAMFFLLPCAITFTLGGSVVRFLFGEKWLPAVFPFQVFMVLAAIRGIIVSHWNSLYVTKGKTITILCISLFYFVLISSLGYIVIPKYGISGMSVVVLGTLLFSIPFSKLTLRPILRYSYTKILRPQIFIFILVFGSGLLISNFAAKSFASFLEGSFLMMLLYIVSLWFFDKEMCLWCLKFVKSLLLNK